jgi:hypothetical protein
VGHRSAAGVAASTPGRSLPPSEAAGAGHRSAAVSTPGRGSSTATDDSDAGRRSGVDDDVSTPGRGSS